MRRWQNPSEVLKEVKAAIDDLNSSRLPAGVRIVPVYDRTDLVNNTLHTVSRTLVEGLVIVVGVLLFFLGSARAALLTALTIPLSLLFAFICMYLVGIPANLLSLGAIDFGIIVDGTFVMVEHIVRRLTERQIVAELESEHTLVTIRVAAMEVARPVFFSLLIIISAYIPLFTMQRVERRLFGPMALTVASALLGSLILSLTLIPALATWLFRRGVKIWENTVIGWVGDFYERLLSRGMRRAYMVGLVSVGLGTVLVLLL